MSATNAKHIIVFGRCQRLSLFGNIMVVHFLWWKSNKNKRRPFKIFTLTPQHSSNVSMDHEKEPCWSCGTSSNGLDVADNLVHSLSYSPWTCCTRFIQGATISSSSSEGVTSCDCQNSPSDSAVGCLPRDERTRISMDEEEDSLSTHEYELATEIRRVLSWCSWTPLFIIS